MYQHLEHLVPEARLAIAHGQMPEHVLSERMQQFTEGQVDVLLSTSIIESGLDIPNANTLIVDRADSFGLAQLYQLRGRVGRGAQRAYAYFFKHARRSPSVEGRERLETIAENTQLGAGYSIAMRDLEIRGAGDILGTRQHGHIAAIGFHLYTRLLLNGRPPAQGSRPAPDPVARHGRRPPAGQRRPALNLASPDYIADKNMRLRLYRRIADLRTPEKWAWRQEIRTAPSAPVENLFPAKVKLAEKAGVSRSAKTINRVALPERRPPPLPHLGPRYG
jgi:transcription-repair coupling factor (superfamily II helicase)